ncbi:MAG: hypothetical protein PHU03_07925 [Syntrophales bacterium]|nr:hypothetical protein [Syntrophales bacterium]
MERKNTLFIFILFAAMAIIVAGGIYFYLGHEKIPEVAEYKEEKEPFVIGEIREKEPMIVREAPPPAEEISPLEPPLEKKDYYHYLEQLRSFCDYLDGSNYIMEYGVEEGTYLRLLSIIKKLSKSGPVIVGETLDADRLAANLYHFYRILGKNDALLAASILTREREKMEPLMALLYQWITMDMDQEIPEADTSIEALYRYGAFFLVTLGGKSYLARRDSKTSFLVRYYSLLIVEWADREMKNPYGIDVLFHLDMLVTDMVLMGNLEKRSNYEEKLRQLRLRLVRE